MRYMVMVDSAVGFAHVATVDVAETSYSRDILRAMEEAFDCEFARRLTEDQCEEHECPMGTVDPDTYAVRSVDRGSDVLAFFGVQDDERWPSLIATLYPCDVYTVVYKGESSYVVERVYETAKGA